MTKTYHVKFMVYSTVDGHTKSEFSDMKTAMDHAQKNAEMLEHAFRVVARYTHRSDPSLNTDIIIATFHGDNMALAGDGSRLVW